MRRLARHLFTLCSVLSLMLCVAACVLWGNSYWEMVLVHYARQPWADEYSVNSYWGAIKIETVRPNAAPSARLDVRWVSVSATMRGRYAGGHVPALRPAIIIPYWLLFLTSAPGAAPVVVKAVRFPARHRRRRQLLLGLCPSCGFDLRASPDRCPECGRAAEGDSPSFRR